MVQSQIRIIRLVSESHWLFYVIDKWPPTKPAAETIFMLGHYFDFVYFRGCKYEVKQKYHKIYNLKYTLNIVDELLL